MIARMSVSIQTILGDAKTSAAIGAGTYGVSMAQVMGWLQSNVGFIGTLVGIMLTIVTIWVQVLNGRRQLYGIEIDALEKERKELEKEILKRELGASKDQPS